MIDISRVYDDTGLLVLTIYVFGANVLEARIPRNSINGYTIILSENECKTIHEIANQIIHNANALLILEFDQNDF